MVGENGAGKSTLIKILSGVYSTDTGEVRLEGERVLLHGPKDAIDRGINTIYQETSLVQDITVAENIFLGRQPAARGGRIDWKLMRESARGIMDSLSIRLSRGRWSTSFPPPSSSWWRSPRRFPGTPGSSSWTSPPLPSPWRTRRTFSASSARSSGRGHPSSTSPTASRRSSRLPTA